MERKRNKTLILKSFTWLIAFLSIILVFGSLMSYFGWMPSGPLEDVNEFLTEIAQLFTFFAILLIISRLVWKVAGKISFLQWFRSVWLFVKLRHVLFGWIAFAAGAAHSLYFLIFIPRDMGGVVSGLIAFGVMIVLVLFGYVLDQKAKTSKAVRIVHTV